MWFNWKYFTCRDVHVFTTIVGQTTLSSVPTEVTRMCQLWYQWMPPQFTWMVTTWVNWSTRASLADAASTRCFSTTAWSGWSQTFHWRVWPRWVMFVIHVIIGWEHEFSHLKVKIKYCWNATWLKSFSHPFICHHWQSVVCKQCYFQLRSLHLESNQLSELTGSEFASLTKLRELYLQNNYLASK